jgi:MFS family permease
MTTTDTPLRTPWLLVALAASTILLVTMGPRQTLGLFVSPLNTATGLGVAAISFALAVGQLMWGAVQPFAGAIADRHGSGRVLAAGLILMGVGAALTPYMDSTFGLVITLGILFSAGSGAASFSVLMSAAAHRLPADKLPMASGIINAGGSMGQFLFAPLLQGVIVLAGWVSALWAVLLVALAALPLARMLRNRATPVEATPTAATPRAEAGAWKAVRDAMQDRSYLLLHAGFFTCGFHIAFLVTHLPGEVALCGLSTEVASWSLGIIGLANVIGSLVAGWWVSRYRSKMVLFWMYGSRAALVVVYLVSPRTPEVFYMFAAGLGFTWLATVPPTAALVGKLFGRRYLATLFGLTLFTHQIGGFLGAWLGGLAITNLGSFELMWYADMALATMAAIVNLPIREARMAPQAQLA